MVNRFDTPANYEYVSQYVPIPFEKLYALGKQYADQRRQAEKDLEENIKTFGKFMSPSSVDTENYYKQSIGTLLPLIQEATANPSAMKSIDFRSRLQNAINNIDYAQLSQYEQSALNLRERQKNIARLQAEGRYNPEMDLIDIANWDTRTNKVMTDLNPIRYQSIRELVEPYVNNLQDLFLYSKGGYNWMGVSEEMVKKQVDANWSSIRNTPIADAHVNALIRRGMSREEAENAFRQQALNDSMEYARKKPVVDPYALASYQNELAMRLATKKAQSKKGKGDEQPGSVLGLSDMLTGQYLQKRQNTFDSVLLASPEFLSRYQKSTQDVQMQIDKVSDEIMSDPTFKKAFDEIKNAAIAKGAADNEELDQTIFQTLLQSDAVSFKNKGRINALMLSYQNLHNSMVDEAEGMAMQNAFNTRLGKTGNVNPFSVINTYMDGGELMYDESKAHAMWEDGLNIMSQPVGPELNQIMLEGLFGNAKKINEEVGYSIDPYKLISPRSIVMDNKYMQKLAQDAGYDKDKIKNMHLDRNTFGKDNLDIEERLAKGDFGKVAIDKVEGYIEQGDTKGLVVSVNVPYKDIEQLYDRIVQWDNPSNTLRDYGFTVSGAPEGVTADSRWSEGYVTVRMVLATGDSDVDKILTNRKHQKDIGTTDSKNTQITQDDVLMQKINNWVPGMGFNKI